MRQQRAFIQNDKSPFEANKDKDSTAKASRVIQTLELKFRQQDNRKTTKTETQKKQVVDEDLVDGKEFFRIGSEIISRK